MDENKEEIVIYKGKEIKSEYKYIKFEKDSAYRDPKGKTICIIIYNKHSDEELGYIEWYEAWRQYCMMTKDDIVFNSQCLKDIAEFMDNLMRIHKQNNHNSATSKNGS